MPRSRISRSTVHGATTTQVVQLAPDLAGAADPEVVLVGLADQFSQFCVTERTGRRRKVVERVADGWGDAAAVLGEHAADRLDTAEAAPVLVDERYERRCGRSGSTAKKLAAALRISFARFSSAISFFIAWIRVHSSVVVPGRRPESSWSRRTQLRSVSAGADARLLRGGPQLSRLIRVVTKDLGGHAHRTTAQLSRVGGRTCHDPNPYPKSGLHRTRGGSLLIWA